MKGIYILIVQLPEAQTITAGSLSDVHFPRGYYAYVGSALNGVESRVSRHLNQNKKLRWHIDYFLEKASITDIIIGETRDRIECAVAQALSSKFNSISGFGSSDCHCNSHLFLSTQRRKMESSITKIFESLAVLPKLMELRGHLK